MNISKNILTEAAGHANVMFLTMSTLPYLPKINTYQINEGGKKLYFKSLSQMEPHTKYVLYMLAEKKEKLDRIVILESRKARTEKPENWNQETATTLFTKRIHNYLGGSEQVDIEAADSLNDLKESAIKPQQYQNGFPEIITVDLEDPVFFWKAVQEILGSDRKRTIHLYMDMQGGDRNAVSQMNAIIKLLERQKVMMEGRYANDFEPKRKIPLHTIREAGKEYRTYDLISAMDIFAQYGWGDKLEQYFGGTVRTNSKERKLIKAIKQASAAISRCNGDAFDNAVRRIEKLESQFKEPEAVTEMDVVYQDIHENYETLFGAKYRYVEQIRWCLDKNFLQQALTIFESKMPYEFIHSGLMYYMTKDGDKEKFLKDCERLYNDLPRKQQYQMIDLNHYLVKDYCNGFDRGKSYFSDPLNLFHFGLDKEKVIGILNKYRKLCGLRNQINHAAVGDYNPEGFFCHMRKKYPNDNNWKNKKETNYEEQIRDYLDEWERLADLVPDELRIRSVDMS